MLKVKGCRVKIQGKVEVVLAETTMMLHFIKEKFGEEAFKEVCRLAKKNEKEIEKEANENNNK